MPPGGVIGVQVTPPQKAGVCVALLYASHEVLSPFIYQPSYWEGVFSALAAIHKQVTLKFFWVQSTHTHTQVFSTLQPKTWTDIK